MYNSYEAEKTRIYPSNNIKTYKEGKKSDNFFLTQGSFNNKKFLKNKISFNGIKKATRYIMLLVNSVSRLSEQIQTN